MFGHARASFGIGQVILLLVKGFYQPLSTLQGMLHLLGPVAPPHRYIMR